MNNLISCKSRALARDFAQWGYPKGENSHSPPWSPARTCSSGAKYNRENTPGVSPEHFIRNDGFSLLELLITMVIIGILLLATTPLYTSFLTKARRSQAEASLMHLASQLEYFHSINQTYQEATLAKLQVNEFTEDHMYQLSIESESDIGYLISATPLGEQTKADSNCGKLQLDEANNQSVTGAQSPNTCWQLL